MEYIPEFAVIQGSLLTLQKKLGVLKHLHKNVKDKEKKDIVVETITKTLNSFGNLTAEKCIKLRQISLFLVLNSDLEVNKVLTEDLYCGHLVDSCPTLSTDILIELMFPPEWNELLFELIIYLPTFVSIELIEIATNYLDKSTQTLIPQSAPILVKATYAKLISLTNESDSHECSYVCAAHKLMKNFSNLLEYFADPKRSLGEHWKNHLSEGLAYLLRSSLDLVSACLKFYISPLQLPEEQLSVYKMNLAYDYSKLHEDTNNFHLNSVHDQLFSILVVQIAYVTVDVWLDWAELDSMFVPNYSMQQDIAECMFKCTEAIQAVEKKGVHSELWGCLLPMLTSMACKPRDEDDEIEESDITLILKKIPDKSCNQRKWFAALFKKYDVFSTQECWEVINKNICLMDFKIARMFLKNILSYLEKDHGVMLPENMKNLFLASVRELSSTDQLLLLKEYLNQTSNYSYLSCEDYLINITKAFNTAVDMEGECNEKMYQEFLNLSFQNPLDVITKLIKHGVASDVQAQLMGDILVMLKPLHTLKPNSESPLNFFVQVLNETMESHCNLEFKDSSLISLIILLVSRNVVSAVHYLKMCLFPLIQKSLAEENWSDLNIWLQILQVFLDGTLKPCYFLNISELLILVEILEKVRKNYASFSGTCIMVNEKVLNIFAIITESSLIDCEGDCLTNVYENVSKLSSPINLLYLFDLWSNLETLPQVIIDWKVFLLHGMNFHKWNLQPNYPCSNLSRKSLLYELIQLLPLSTVSEWRHITQNLLSVSPSSLCASPKSVFDHFIDGIEIIILMQSSQELSREERECSLSCIDYCVRNLTIILKEEILGQLHSISVGDAATMFQKIIHFYEALPSVIQDSCVGSVLNVEVDLITFTISEMQMYCNCDEDEVQSIKLQQEEIFRQMAISVTHVQNGKSRQALAHKIQGGFASVVS